MTTAGLFSTLSLVRIGAVFGTGALAGGTVSRKWESLKNKKMESQAISEAALTTSSSLSETVSKHPSLMKYGKPENLSPGPLCYGNHCLEFDGQRRVPLWVAEHLSKEKISPKENAANRKHSKFRPDPSLPAEIRASNDDFWDSGWSRGHMAPAGNNKHCQKSMDDTFLLSNIVPQDFDNNGDFWNRLEIYCRDLTKQFSDVWVVSGPLWLPDAPEEAKVVEEKGDKKERRERWKKNKVMKYEVLGNNQVAVPTHLYKVILAENHSNEQHPLMAAFLVPNKPIERRKNLLDFKIPLSDLERHLGYRLFHRLDRSQVEDLCQVDGCKMMDYRKFQSYFIGRGINGARNERDLDRYWKKAVDLDLVTPDLQELREKKTAELKERAKHSENKDKVSAAAAG